MKRTFNTYDLVKISSDPNFEKNKSHLLPDYKFLYFFSENST